MAVTTQKTVDPTENEPKQPALNFSSSEDPMCAYLLTEVSIFNNRVVWYLEQQQKQEIFALGASGILWAYLLKGEGEIFSLAVALVPPLITIILFVKSIIMTKAMVESMDYLEKLENSFELKNHLGWVHYYKKNTSNYKKKWRKYFWSGLVVVNVVISGIFIIFNQITKPKNISQIERLSLSTGEKQHRSYDLDVKGTIRYTPKKVLNNK